MKEGLASGQTLYSGSTDETALATARCIGTITGLEELLKTHWED